MATTTRAAGIYDDAGRYLAPLAIVLPVRPMGAWDTNHDTRTPRAVFAFFQPSFDGVGPGFKMYHVIGGESDKSTVSADTLRDLGIVVP